MTDEELVARPLDEVFDTMMDVERNPHGAWEAIQTQADRIEALTAEVALMTARGMMGRQWATETEARQKAEAERDAAVEGLQNIAADASVTVHTWKNGINFKKMYEGWRKIATERIDIARATLAKITGDSHE